MSQGGDRELIGGQALYNALKAGSVWLQSHVAEVNALNVFPVPDGDTGTNMSLTLRAALDEVGSPQGLSVSEVGRRISHGALMGARGNSGVILSQILRGFARALDDKQAVTEQDVALGLTAASETAYKGVMKPVEGTILTVMREAAEAAQGAISVGGDVCAVLTAALSEAKASLLRTPELLPVLKEAGVVDAGGQGLVRVLEGILSYVRGDAVVADAEAKPAVETGHGHADAAEEEYGFDVQFIIHSPAKSVDLLREDLSVMGDSLLVVGDEQAVKVHIHSEHPGPILEYGIQQGTLSTIILENMQVQYREFVGTDHSDEGASGQIDVRYPVDRIRASLSGASPLADVSVVAVASGPGLAQVFSSLGAEAVVAGGQTMNPSTQDLVSAIESVANDSVLILPNNGNIILTAQQASEITSRQVRVVPTRTMPQGIAALLGFNYQAGLEENYEAMLESSQQVETLEVTQAVRSVQVNGLAVDEGQFIGLLNDDLRAAGDTPLAVVKALLGEMDMDEYEIISVYYGSGVTQEEASSLCEALGDVYPNLEYELLDGGQPHYHYIISAE
ncbi:MAG: DAK2 domain-containing protein [Chloroflexi bacterium]|nr:DAK2 domain-containing protein [Chloroflexota bacterium]